MTEHADADIGLVGLAVMGQNLALNMADHGATVAVFNRTTSVTRDFLERRVQGQSIVGCDTIEDLVAALVRPRRVMLMVKSGPAVDAVIDQLVPLLDAGDIIIDGGNSQWSDTARRVAALEERGVRYVGAGVSGGEDGARHGPSIMPGGSTEAWPVLKELFQSIAAQVDGEPCCDWIGPSGSGHYVKMVHNGIEYGDMEVLAEAYWLLRATGMSHPEMAEVFAGWNDGVLQSFLVEITADILSRIDEHTGEPLAEVILDAAGQKGTGKWTVVSAMELGQPVTLVAEAVAARIVSSFKDLRVRASGVLGGGSLRPEVDVEDLRDAVYASKIISYTQGFGLLRAASVEHGWDLDLGRIASLWRGGCIIRAAFLNDITAAFGRDPSLELLLLDDFFRQAASAAVPGWRRVVGEAVRAGLAVPAFVSALSFYDAIRSERLPANLIQAQRDYFGAHTYERVDRSRGEFFHTDWIASGGGVTASSYQA